MSASDEWETQYLTDNGWVVGGYKYDHGECKHDVKPEGAVLSVHRHVTVGALGAPSSVKAAVSRTPLINDTQKINTLLAVFGEPTFGV